jgi:lysophospholipase L1-like esterase
MDRRQFCGLTLAALGSLGLDRSRAQAQAGGAFFFRDRDRVVMIGDSITEQLLHSNYVESFVLSRFPRWDMRWRNVGIGGDTSTGGNRRTTRDILSFNPSAVTITFGMNDGGYRQPHDQARLEAYRTGLQGMLEQLKGKPIRTAVLSSSPVEKAEDGPALQGYNETLELFAATAAEVAKSGGAVFVDQIHPHLTALQKARDAAPKNRINGGDAVHPGAPGQVLMAWAILKGLNAPPLVSTVEIGSPGERPSARNCVVTGLRRDGTKVRFVRADEAVPWWIPVNSRSILPWAPVAELDQYLLKVSGLPAGPCSVMIDGEKALGTTGEELGKGLNLALATEGPVARQAQAVNDAVFAKNRYYHDQIFRGVVLNNAVPEAEKASAIEQRMQGMPPLEQAIRDALALRPRIWEVVPG